MNLRRRPRTAGPVEPTTSPPSEPSPPRARSPLHPESVSVHPSPLRRSPGIVCPQCDRTFQTKIGLGVHRRRAHPDEVNDEVNVDRVKKQWSSEELRLMAREEALALRRGGVRFMNQHLMSVLTSGRTLDAIKGARRREAYKALVEQALCDMAAASGASETLGSPSSSEEGDSDSSFHATTSEVVVGPPMSIGSPQPSSTRSTWHGEAMGSNFSSAIEQLLPIVECSQGFQALMLVEIGQRLLNGCDVASECCSWLRAVFPVPPRHTPRSTRPEPVHLTRKRQRRREYARVQQCWKQNMARAVKQILDGTPEAGSRPPDVATMAAHWGPFVSRESVPVPDLRTTPVPSLQHVWHPITCDEITKAVVASSSAAGIDGITARQWKAVPATIKALFFNIVLATGGMSRDALMSRTVFVPKKAGGADPGDFRPISIASVPVRHLHKILAKRLREAGLVDVRQRCLDGGCAENIAVVASLLEDSRRNLRELHVVSLDVAKAFDAVSHHAILAALGRTGLPRGFINYISHLYHNSSTVFEVEGRRSSPFNVQRGVRQGDPLSSLLFCLVVDEVLGAVPPEVGYTIEGCRVNALAFADDIILVTSTKAGMTATLSAVEERARERGLSFSAQKCVSLSIVPAGKQKKYKVLSDPLYCLSSGGTIPQLSPSREWRYLGVDFRPVGPKRAGGTISTELERLTRAPLKPQQRLKALRCFLIPRFYHSLVLAGTTLGKLRALDKQVRTALRKWLRLPHDTPTGYFHTPCKLGGLGIPAFATTVPGLMVGYLSRLQLSSSPAVRAVASSSWVFKRLSWAERALTKDGNVLTTAEARSRWWADHLYRSVDGRELRECGVSSVSTWWVDAGSLGIPGRDYIQYNHVRVNSLPTLIRTSRGVRREVRELHCRAGCDAVETAAHVIQACHRTHGGRVKRHDAVCKVLAFGLRDRGWTVSEEPRIRTSLGLRKPDLVAKKDDRIWVIDAQVVSGATPLDEAHRRKKEYYQGNSDILRQLTEDSGVSSDNVHFTTCTVSWRGVWSARSAEHLLGLGLPRRLLCGITTRVLQGSHTNWVRWNRMTGIGVHEGHPRVGVG